MNINFNPKITSYTPIQSEATTQQPAGLSTKTEVSLTGGVDELLKTSGEEAVGDAALMRNDPLGKLMSLAFNLPAPEMPVFG